MIGTCVRGNVPEIASKPVVTCADGLRPEVVVPSVVVMSTAGELHPVSDIDVAFIGEFVLVIHVAQYGIGNSGVNALDQMLFVDSGIHTVLA